MEDEANQVIEARINTLKRTVTELRSAKLRQKEHIENAEAEISKLDEQIVGVSNQIAAYQEIARLNEAKNGSDEDAD